MEDMLKQGLAPVYTFADRSVSMGARPEHYEVIAEVLPIALEVRRRTSCYIKEGCEVEGGRSLSERRTQGEMIIFRHGNTRTKTCHPCG